MQNINWPIDYSWFLLLHKYFRFKNKSFSIIVGCIVKNASKTSSSWVLGYVLLHIKSFHILAMHIFCVFALIWTLSLKYYYFANLILDNFLIHIVYFIATYSDTRKFLVNLKLPIKGLFSSKTCYSWSYFHA